MRIVLLNQYYAPDEAATAQLLSDLGEGLAGAGHDVTALCSDRAYADPARRYPREENLHGVAVHRVRTSGFGRRTKVGRILDYATFLSGAAWALLFRRGTDVIVSLSTPPLVAALGVLLGRVRCARSVFWVMDVYPELAFELGVLRPGSLGGAVVGRVSRSTIRGSDRVVALDESMAVRLRQAGARRVEVIENWADGAAIVPRPVAGHPLRREWGWDGRFVVLYSGNMGLAHEFETVLDAAEKLRADPRILVAFVGDGPRRPWIEDQVRRRGLTNVELRPYQTRDRLGESLTAGDVHLITLGEKMAGLVVPSKIYGILAAGRPTLYVGPAEGAVARIVTAERCGRRVTNGDGDALVEAVRLYASDPGLCGEEGERARNVFEARHSKEQAVGAFRRLLEDLGAD